MKLKPIDPKLMKTVKPAVAEPAVTKSPEIEVPDDPKWIMHKEGAIAVYGANLISKKDLIIMASALHSDVFTGPDGVKHNTRMIIIRDDNMPQDINGDAIMGAADPNFKAISLNLQEIFAAAADSTIENAGYSLLTSWHIQLHSTFLHEVRHLMLQHVRIADDDIAKERDEDADDWARDTFNLLAKTVDIEPTSWAESPFFARAALSFIDDCAEGKEEFAKSQKHMLDNHIMWTSDDETYTNSFKILMQCMCGAAMDDPEWTLNTNGMVQAEQWVHENGMGIPATSTAQRGVEYQQVYDETGVDTAEGTPMGDYYAGPAGNPHNPAGYQNEYMYDDHYDQTDMYNYAQEPVKPASGYQAPNPQTGATYAPQQQGNQYSQQPSAEADHAVRTILGVYAKCRDHIFGLCKPMVNSDMPFANPEAVIHQPLMLTPEEMKYVVGFDAMDANGRMCPAIPSSHGLRGQITAKAKIPNYVLRIKDNAGNIVVRKILPQNTSGNGTRSMEARNGARHCYVYEGDPRVEAEVKRTGGQFANRYLEALNGGQFVPVS